ncbi:Uma2 family endonuclease [Spirulina major]|uniref:Uma2 family endonuclease n=1 Tax=Spirulina major TaxID=270636 RepID=UPI00093495A0|nr:Uma2 family endonuclease [Spirulina major]
MVANLNPKHHWTIADLAFFPDNDHRYEIIAGELYVTRAPHWKHQNAINNLGTYLTLWAKQHQQGKVLTTPGLIFSGEDNVIPDLVWISDELLATAVDESGHFTAAPELVVEVLSQTPRDIMRDRQVKLKLYSRVGVRDYWIIDWQQQRIELYRRSQAHLEQVSTLFIEDQLTSPLFPDFTLAVADIFS